MANLEAAIEKLGVGCIASVVGRYWAMDRDKRWERTERAYRLLTERVGSSFSRAADAVRAGYESDTGDVFLEPSVVGDPRRGSLEMGTHERVQLSIGSGAPDLRSFGV